MLAVVVVVVNEVDVQVELVEDVGVDCTLTVDKDSYALHFVRRDLPASDAANLTES